MSRPIRALALACLAVAPAQASGPQSPPVQRGYTIPLLDLADQKQRQVVVDREQGQYLGHPTTVLLEDGRTILAVYPKGHGKGAIVLKRSTDGGLTWSDRLPVPENWATSQETPTIHRVVDPQGKRRLILFSGLYPIRMASSEDDGRTWTPLEPIGDFGGIVAMASVERLKNGDYMALFHDDGRFLRGEGKKSKFRVYKTISHDGGRTWGQPEVIAEHPDADLCEPGLVRSPDGKQIAVLLRENRRKHNSFVIFSDDEGKTWTEPRELPGSLTGRPARRQVRPRRPAVRLVPGHDAREPDEGRLGRLGRHLRRHRGRAGGPVPGPADGQHEGGSTAPTPAWRCCPTARSSPPPTGTGPRASRRTSSACGSRWRNSTPWRRRAEGGDQGAQAPAPGAAAVTVADTDGLRRALADAVPGTTIRIAPGTYRGGLSARGLRGEPGRPIVLAAADPERPPVFEGGDSGLHLSDPAHVELHDLVVAGVRGNGINIDDGGSPDTPAHHVVLRGLVVRDIGPAGNRDGIKLSGVDDFRVEGCTVERWGDRGSGIDMVGCHRGEVAGCTFRHGDRQGDNGVQAKGGSSEIIDPPLPVRARRAAGGEPRRQHRAGLLPAQARRATRPRTSRSRTAPSSAR